jgi:hypothetical protein
VDGTSAPYTAARELSRHDITVRLVEDFERAASAAKRCGFDFVEIHGAHGILPSLLGCPLWLPLRCTHQILHGFWNLNVAVFFLVCRVSF